MTDVRMIDVGAKATTRRRALARCEVHMSDEALAKIEEGTVAKGDVFATARVAGIAAAKKTPDLLPLCHPLMLDYVRVDLAVDRAAGCVRIEAECALDGRTGEAPAQAVSQSWWHRDGGHAACGRHGRPQQSPEQRKKRQQ